jgi:hypothetical protein
VRRRALAVAVALSGCTGQVGDATEPPLAPPPAPAAAETARRAWIETPGGSTALAFAALGGAGRPADLLALAPGRLGIDIFVPSETDAGSWSFFGAAYVGPEEPQAIAVGAVAGRAIVAARIGARRVSVLAAVPDQPHKLRAPVRAAHADEVVAHALGDLDGDGSDELVMATGKGIRIVGDLVKTLDADPEGSVTLSHAWLDQHFVAGALAVIDFDGDGENDVVALEHDAARARLYRRCAPCERGYEPADVALPAPARSLVTTHCPGFEVAAALASGGVVSIDATGVAPLAPSPDGIDQVAGASTALGVARASSGAIDLLRGCGAHATRLEPGLGAVRSLSLGEGGAVVAALGEDGRRIALLVPEPAQ